ncbi:hypothetical protein BIFDEN_01961 [Bifidobacterium dentium ATCC 27678]|nr:hypothetical protein BIFDEN_01961 [Bifidobacterium dentium ATCC 27678]
MHTVSRDDFVDELSPTVFLVTCSTHSHPFATGSTRKCPSLNQNRQGKTSLCPHWEDTHSS